MQTFKQYLAEISQSEVTVEKAAEFIKTRCKKYLASRSTIWRGVKSRNVAILGSSSSGPDRKSSGQEVNLYTNFLDKSPIWKDFPKRSKSFICTTSADTTTIYGNAYLVFPADDALIAKVPTYDIWAAFIDKLNHMKLNTLQEIIVDVLTIGFARIGLKTPKNLYKEDLSLEEVNEILSLVNRKNLEQIQDSVPDEKDDEDDFATSVMNNNFDKLRELLRRTSSESLKEVFEKSIVPDKFKVSKAADINFKLDGDFELYIEGDVVMVSYQYLEQLWALLK